MSTTAWHDFAKIDIRLGTVAEAAPFPEARKPPQIGPVISEVLVLGFPDAQGAVCLVTVDPPAPDGGRLF